MLRAVRRTSHAGALQQLGVDAECGVSIEVGGGEAHRVPGRFASRRAIQAETSRSLQR